MGLNSVVGASGRIASDHVGTSHVKTGTSKALASATPQIQWRTEAGTRLNNSTPPRPSNKAKPPLNSAAQNNKVIDSRFIALTLVFLLFFDQTCQFVPFGLGKFRV